MNSWDLIQRGIASIAAAIVIAICVPAAFVTAQSGKSPTSPVPAAPTTVLDYEFFKTRVEPIFLKRRSEAHARCYACHGYSGVAGAGGSGSPPQYLVKLTPGSSFWTEEQSRINFERVSRLVVPGDPSATRLLTFPLAPEAGGSTEIPLHIGGRQFESKNDPDWQTIEKWVRGQKAGGSSP